MEEYDEVIPNPFENGGTPYDSLTQEGRVEAIRESVLLMTEAVSDLLLMVIELKKHTREHCDTFATQADAIIDAEDRLKVLEQMLAGDVGLDPVDPNCEVDE